MTRKPLFWIVLSLAAVVGLVLTFAYFPQAFPIVTLDLKMDRAGALEKARALAVKSKWEPEEFRQAASFTLDSRVQYFVELEAGGTGAFRDMLNEGLYSPYTWQVRHFRENETKETRVIFTPAGELFGFSQKLPEKEAGASLAPEEARSLAESAASQEWQVDLAAYELIEQSQEVRPGGRIDHTLVFQRPDVQIGEGRYRLRLMVAGDRLTELSRFVHIPEAFERRYEEMRSANEAINTAAMIGMILLLLGGCVGGLFYLLRQRWVIWRQPLIWGLAISAIMAVMIINYWPLAWMEYDTAVSRQNFIVRQIVLVLAQFLGMGLLYTLSFMAAESLSRRAFPHHVQLWRSWSPEVASTTTVLGQTVGGYLLIGIFFAYEVGLYFFSSRVLDWWTPSSALFNPDVLATYFPWLTSIAVSLQAGFWEECLFRAVPIAGAALLGKRFGRQRAWIVGALIFQAVLFGAGHANYPAQPAYARLVELILPAILFGLIYLFFGLVPAIVLHFAFDVCWIAIPLFVSQAPGVWVDQVMVVLLTLVPLWVVLARRLKRGAWGSVPESDLNQAWAPPEVAPPIEVPTAPIPAPTLPMTRQRLLWIAGAVGLVAWLVLSQFHSDAPPLTVSRGQAVAAASESLQNRGIELTEPWKILPSVEASLDSEVRFVWQEAGEEVYGGLLGSHLPGPHWTVRFAQFEGDIAERAEEYRVAVDRDGEVYRFTHRLPEARSGAALSEDEAREIAVEVLGRQFGVETSELEEVSAVPSKRPDRTDWLLTFRHPAVWPLEDGEARYVVEILGDEIGDAYRHVYVPEDWAREQRDKRAIATAVQTFSWILITVVVLAGLIGGVVSWSRKIFSLRSFLLFFGVLAVLDLLGLFNHWPAVKASFSTAQPFQLQTWMALGLLAVFALFMAAAVALVIGFVHAWKGEGSATASSEKLWLGLSLGGLAAGILAAVTTFGPSLAPTWGSYAAAAEILPFLSEGVLPVSDYIGGTALLLLLFTAVHRLSDRWSRRQGLATGALLLVGLAFAGTVSAESLLYWVVSGAVMGLVLFAAYAWVLRFDLAIIPLATGVLAAVVGIKQGLLGAHPAALPGGICAAVLILAVAYYWFLQLEE